MRTLWSKQQEVIFFRESLKFATPEQLFYKAKDGEYYAYWPKGYKGIKATLQSRNALIGTYAERWITDLFKDIATMAGGFSVQGVICEEIGLVKRSRADVAICKTKEIVQKPEDILLILEVKISIVWNWKLQQAKNKIVCIGDYRTHQGNPGLLRSDTMLKAIGKSINIRVSSLSASKIPIIIIGNTPITKAYFDKVDHLKSNGIIQGFWSVNPNPLDGNKENVKNTPYRGFYRFDSYNELKKQALALLKEEREFFSSMKSRKELGKIIEIANKETTYEEKAQKFLELIKDTSEKYGQSKLL